MDKVIITVATTGAWGSKLDSPFIPISACEIIDEVKQCAEAGAAIAHIHARNAAGKESVLVDDFLPIINGIRAEVKDIILNVSTAGPPPNALRMHHLSILKPEMASYDCGSMNWNHHHVFLNDPPFLEALGYTMQAEGVKPEIEIFDVGMMENAIYYLKKGVLKPPLHFQFVMGVPGGIAATVKNLVFLKEHLPQDATWSAFGIGKDHLKIMYASIALGATGVRVGMEDNLYYRKGQLAKSNAEFVLRAKRIIEEFGKTVATTDDARSILGL